MNIFLVLFKWNWNFIAENLFESFLFYWWNWKGNILLVKRQKIWNNISCAQLLIVKTIFLYFYLYPLHWRSLHITFHFNITYILCFPPFIYQDIFFVPFDVYEIYLLSGFSEKIHSIYRLIDFQFNTVLAGNKANKTHNTTLYNSFSISLKFRNKMNGKKTFNAVFLVQHGLIRGKKLLTYFIHNITICALDRMSILFKEYGLKLKEMFVQHKHRLFDYYEMKNCCWY